MRFDCGTVGAKKIPDILNLNELDQAGGVLFRIKVVDQENGRASYCFSGPSTAIDRGRHMGRESIFPVEYRDLGQEVWRVEIEDDAGPFLC